MKRILTFLKNYRKILIGAFICLLIVNAVSFLLLFFSIASDISAVNRTQLPKISKKAEQISEHIDSFAVIDKLTTSTEMTVLYHLLHSNPEDIENPELLDKYYGYLNNLLNLTVVDRNLDTVYSWDNQKITDFHDSRYRTLFSGNDGKVTEYGDYIAIKCIDHYFITKLDEKYADSVRLDTPEVWELAHQFVGLDNYGSFAVIDSTDGSVLYSNDPSLSGKTLSFRKLTPHILMTADRRYFVQTCPAENNVMLCSLSDPHKVVADCFSSIEIVLIVFLMALVVLLSLVICLRQGELDPAQEYSFARKYFLRSQTKHFKTVSVLSGLCLGALFIILVNLKKDINDLDFTVKDNVSCAEAINDFSAIRKEAVELNNKYLYDYARLIGSYLNEHPDRMTKTDLQQLSSIFRIKYITVFDSAGKTKCTSSPLDHAVISDDPDNQLYDLKYVLMGYEGMTIRSVDLADSDKTENIIYSVPFRNEEGIADGIISLTALNGESNEVVSYLHEIESGFPEYQRSLPGSIILTVDESGAVLSVDDIEKPAIQAVDMETVPLRDGYYGSMELNQDKCLASVCEIKNTGDYLVTIVQIDWFSKATILGCLFVLFMYALICFWIWYDGLGSRYHFEERKQKVKDADDWERKELYWEELTLGKKMGRILSLCVYIFSVILVLARILYRKGVLDNNNISYLVSNSWKESINGYSVLGNLCIICVFYSAIKLVEAIFSRIETLSERNSTTICRLIISCTNYVGAISCAYIVVTNFGVDAGTALASIGILGFALTFGAQDLIKDVIAGMFILFEGNFKVGDMILLGGDWFWIRSIGVRTTTLEAWGQVKVVNNSQMTGIVNLQRASSAVNCDVMIGNDVDLDFVETVLSEELPLLKKNFPPEVATPLFAGVQKFSAEGTVIRVKTYCPPKKQGSTGRSLRRYLKRILDENGIRLAYEAYVVHSTDVTPQELLKEQGSGEES